RRPVSLAAPRRPGHPRRADPRTRPVERPLAPGRDRPVRRCRRDGDRCAWLDRAVAALRGPSFAVFDTRAHKPELLVGSAAHGIAHRIRRRGYRVAVEPESFFGSGTPGPLEEGELEPAAERGEALASEVMSPAA